MMSLPNTAATLVEINAPTTFMIAAMIRARRGGSAHA